MKYPKSEPYQRSRHRATLQSWVLAATAVAAIGLPAAAATTLRDDDQQVQRNDQAASLDPQDVAAHWIAALYQADTALALDMMRLPARADDQRAVQSDLDVLVDLLSDDSVHAEPIAHRRQGHWAMSAWQLDQPATSLAPVIEPIALYHPSADGLVDTSDQWQVVPQAMADDPALQPLYNADYEALREWAELL
jgi:hypothetical protein